MGCNGVGRRDVKTLEEVEEEGGGYIRGLKWPARYLHVQKHKIYDGKGNLHCNADKQRGGLSDFGGMQNVCTDQYR